MRKREGLIGGGRAEQKAAVQDGLRKRKVADVGSGEKVSIPTKGINEPSFRHSRRTGRSEHIVPGNKEYVVGDEIPRPSGASGGRGPEGSPGGDGERSFDVTLSHAISLDSAFALRKLPDPIHPPPHSTHT